MDPRLLRYYNQELRYLRELGGEFAREFPKVAARLGMEGLEVSDPYVERLLEGCAFLAARVQLKQDAEFPRFSHRLLELVYPNFLAPLPAMLVAQVQPQLSDPNLLACPELPQGTALFSAPLSHTPTRCEFRTAQALQLTPLSTVSADYFRNVGDLGLGGSGGAMRPRCGVRVRLALPAGASLAKLRLDRLRFYLGGQVEVGMRLHELMVSSCVGVLVGVPGNPAGREMLDAACVQAVGYADGEAMLPMQLRGQAGTRLVQEYFAFAERFLFIEVQGLQSVLNGLPGETLELNFLFDRLGTGLDGVVEPANFSLHCAPAINLFPKRADRIGLSEGQHEYHVVPDRTAPLDYEVYDITGLSGIDDAGQEREFLPLYAPAHDNPMRQSAYFSAWREPRLPSEQARRDGPRSGYVGSEVFVTLVDPEDAPVDLGIRQLSVRTRCTNRDLSIFVGSTAAGAELSLEPGLPVQGARCIAGPSRPHTALREGGVAWRFINLLSLNYLSLVDIEPGSAAAVLRDMLSRFPLGTEPAQRRQIETLQRVVARSVVRRHPAPGPIAFSRGIEIELHVDELGFEGSSAVLFGAVLHHHLSRHASTNSFVETVLISLSRGELMRWRPMLGRRAVR
ncbi:type VI secretion system baseplate subunit TssF [Aquariibacter albus]|uniref:Type VI secretion system baseplate subunit TssF n=1 Tax=Aquariibacter albus TaxID=2759899 RepID=A0A839HUF2_9BURK|nr:type VI secretion system baseplate subunit TssF [Aquariibacter albus]MBB1163161.1 type VI secretion system baseplate subunit TssF [Aquariibacter albus]